MSDRTKLLERVQALLDKADASPFGPERDAFRAKADELMLKYAIEHSELIRREGRSLKDQVIQRTMEVGDDDAWITEHLDTLLRRTATHCRCEHIGHPPYRSPWDPKGTTYTRKMTLVGMEADVDYAQMLYTSLRLQMANQLEPIYDHGKSLEDNVYTMRNAGVKWERLEELCGLGPNGPAQRAYAAACAARDEQPRKRVNPVMVQRNFVRGFVTEVVHRFWELKKAQQEADSEGTGGAALVPVTDAVKDRFKEMFPNVSYGKAKSDSGKYDPASYGRGKEAGRRADLGQPKVAQRPSVGDGS